VSRRLEELDWRETPMGAISLRRRWEPSLDVDVYEVKLDDDFLMSSLFTVAEEELGRLGLAALPDPGAGLDVVVGGLGLGYTARAVLDDARVRSLVVVEALDEVISWHRARLVPLGEQLSSDPRCRLVHGDFFATTLGDGPYAADDDPARRHHAILVDIDHSPAHLLHPSHAAFYEPAGLQRIVARLRPSGVFALWSDDPPDDAFVRMLHQAFETVQAHVVRFANHYTGGTSSNTVYVATAPGEHG
jgi:spermidine synthase